MLVESIPYSGKLSREKTFVNFAVLWLFAKVFSAKFGGMASIGTVKASNLRKFSLRKSYFSPIHKSFPLSSTVQSTQFSVLTNEWATLTMEVVIRQGSGDLAI